MMTLHQPMRGKIKLFNFNLIIKNYILKNFCSSSKGNSEEETNSNGGDQFVDCVISTTFDEIKSNEDEHNEKVNGIEEKFDDVSGENSTESNG
jgi:hypothetical protein